MPIGIWTHPKHDIVAAISLLINIVSVVLAFYAVGLQPWFVDYRSRRFRKFVDIKDDKMHCLFESNVYCGNDICRYSAAKDQETWQSVAFMFLMAGVGFNTLAVSIQLLLFWPLAVNGTVINSLLRSCIVLDFIGAPGKFVCAFIFVHHSPKINLNYTWMKEKGALQLEPLPIALTLFSYILQTLAFMLLIIATDKGARGGYTHLERIEMEQDMVLKAQEELEARSRGGSLYVPDSSEAHSRTLSQRAEQEYEERLTRHSLYAPDAAESHHRTLSKIKESSADLVTQGVV